MTTNDTRAGASTLWILLLTLASTATTLVLACATPFPALAALAAVHMHRGDGVKLMGAAWFASQAVGFLILDYPHGLSTFGWAVGLAFAAIGSALGAYAALARTAARSLAVRLAVAYVAGFVAFKAIVLVFALGLGGVASTIDPAIVARQFVRNGAILVGLLAIYHALVAVGLPAARGRAVTS